MLILFFNGASHPNKQNRCFCTINAQMKMVALQLQINIHYFFFAIRWIVDVECEAVN